MPKDHKTISKMDRCVMDVQKQGKDKKAAIAICYTSIMGEKPKDDEVESMTASAPGIPLLEAPPNVFSELALSSEMQMGRVMVFKNAIVARAERNGNGDGLTSEGLEELATTLPLMPLDIDHNRSKVMGMFTAARTRDWKRAENDVVSGGELSADGIIFADNFPVETEEVVKGERKLSIYADVTRAVCSECQDMPKGKDTYCAPGNGATRYVFGLRAKGAGTTKKPAGTGTTFDTENGLLMVAELELESAKGEDEPIPTTTVSEEQSQQEGNMTDEQEKQYKATIEGLEARVKELERQVASAGDEKNTAVAAATKETADKYTKAVERVITLLPVFGDEKAKKEVTRLANMDEDTFSLMAEIAAKKETPAPTVIVGGDRTNNNHQVTEDSLENLA
ncbi:MAG: hypothetical protein WC822_06100 [Candidatus Paceibacterota bacterium]|jgi:hypothetical protein